MKGTFLSKDLYLLDCAPSPGDSLSLEARPTESPFEEGVRLLQPTTEPLWGTELKHTQDLNRLRVLVLPS